MNKEYAPGTLDDTTIELMLLQDVIQRLISDSTHPNHFYRGICGVISTSWIYYAHHYGISTNKAPIDYFPLLFKSIHEEVRKIGFNAGYMAPLTADGLRIRIDFLVRKVASVKLNLRRLDFPQKNQWISSDD
jgi:hypothetical protein